MVPEGWVATSLGECVSFRSGGTPSKRNPDYWDGDIPWISAKDLKSHRITDAQDHLTDAGAASAKMAEPDNILLLVRGMTLLKDVPVGLVTRSMAFNQDIKALVSSLNVDPLFLSYLLVGKRLAMMGLVNTANHGTGRLDTDLLKSLPLVLPPLPEQRKIADILTTWDQTIETTEALLAAARAQKRALMQSLLTGKRRFPEFTGQEWKEIRLGDIVAVNSRQTKKPNDKRFTFLSMDAVSEEGKILNPVEGTADQHGSGYTRFQEGDVLVAKITPCFENGKGCHARRLINGIGAGSTEFHVLRAYNAADQRFLYHVVNSYPFRRRGELNMQGSAGQRRVPPDFIRLFRVHAPFRSEQRGKVSKILDTCDEIVENHRQKIEKLRTEKKALMQQLLTGKRRVKIDSDVDRIIDEATTHG